VKAYRSRLFHSLADPASCANPSDSYAYFDDGLLLIDEGKVVAAGEAESLLSHYPGLEVESLPHHLLLPGFVDTHVHYPQVDVIGSYGEQLMEWLQNYTFPNEQRFSDKAFAREAAEFFLDQLLGAGTTTALVFATVHPASVDAFFEACEARHLRMISGKVLMDQHAPEGLTDTPESAYRDSRALIERWHGKDRLLYAITPRFAATSSSAQLDQAGKLLAEFPGVYVHTHLSENHNEIAFVAEQHPECRDYLDVYHQHGLTGPRSVFAHSIHLDEAQWQCLQDTHSCVAHCPTSNLFLGSGLFALDQAQQHQVRVGLGTDIGGGTSFSMLKTLDEAYKVQRLRGSTLSPLQGFYLATLGGARCLSLEPHIGNFEPGKEADFIALNLNATPLLKQRTERCQNIEELLFVLNVCGDERSVERVWIMGQEQSGL